MAKVELDAKVALMEAMRNKMLKYHLKELDYFEALQIAQSRQPANASFYAASANETCDYDCSAQCYQNASSLNATGGDIFFDCVWPKCQGCGPKYSLKAIQKKIQLERDALQAAVNISENATVNATLNATQNVSALPLPAYFDTLNASENLAANRSILDCDLKCAKTECLVLKKDIKIESVVACTRNLCQCAFNLTSPIAEQLETEMSVRNSTGAVNDTLLVSLFWFKSEEDKSIDTSVANVTVNESLPVVNETLPLSNDT